jgi:hypothetical protein
MDSKRFLPWDLHRQIDVTVTHQCGLASSESVGAARNKELFPRADRQSIGRQHSLLGEAKFDSRDLRQRRAVSGPEAPFKIHSNRCSVRARQRKGRESPAQGDDQRSVLRALTLGHCGNYAQKGECQ